MTYDDWLKHRQSTENLVENLVLAAEGAAKAPDDQNAKIGVIKQFKELPFSQRIWEVFFANAFHLAGVKRIDKRPYATHPTRMALSCYALAKGAMADDSAAPALLHDYLEESGGISLESIALLRKRLPNEPLAVPSAVFLSEPLIAYEKLGTPDDRSKLKRMAYIIQARDALRRGFPQALANASVVDKLDNLHDLGYLDKETSQFKKSLKIAQRLAFFKLTHLEIGTYASPKFSSVLADAIIARAREFKIETLVSAELESLLSMMEQTESAMEDMIVQYHKNIEPD